MQELEKWSFTKDDPWGEVLAATARAMRSVYHTMLVATLEQLILDWKVIQLHSKILDTIAV
eukprot:4527709-Ditylum_brightwellii.AAC.1